MNCASKILGRIITMKTNNQLKKLLLVATVAAAGTVGVVNQ